MSSESVKIATIQKSANLSSIDGLFSGTKWSFSTVKYSMPDSISDYQFGYFNGSDTSGFSKLTTLQSVAFHTAMDSVSSFTNLDLVFVDGGSGEGTIRAANIRDANPTAYAYYPANNMWGGDIFEGDMNDGTSNSMKSPVSGNFAWFTILHESGHALGLKHGHESGGPTDAALPVNLDSIEFSVMTYRTYIGGPATYSTHDFPQTYMMLDIAALQEMYGADFTTNSGNTIYSWDPELGTTFVDGVKSTNAASEIIFATIWDGGGVDTYDLSSYKDDLVLDLQPGGSCSFGGQLAQLSGGPNDVSLVVIFLTPSSFRMIHVL